MASQFNKLFFTLASLFCSAAFAGDKLPLGYPSRSGTIDIEKHFASPPKGYGNVPFYWWNGDTLTKERLLHQLDVMEESATDGFAVSYIHTHPKIDIEQNSKGYGSFGRADGGRPEVFSDHWWSLWKWFSGECARRGMGAGVDDYVIGWAGNGYYVDELRADKGFSDYQGRLDFQSYAVKQGDTLRLDIPDNAISLMAYPQGADLLPLKSNGKLQWTPVDADAVVHMVTTTASYELHPEYGRRLIDVYFQRFEDKLDAKERRGMNFFFQDELHYNLTMTSWCEDMAEEFFRRKGYDVRPYLAALHTDIGAITAKVRLDYAHVLTQLSEERYFKPIFDWHNSRKLIYGCDNNGRGLNPLEYVDYFRSISWFTAPGNDAPARGSSFRQTKVSSSAAHLYQRPRVWLEAFHSMGWDSNGEWLTKQLDHHMIAGGNLLCLHGLYYSTHGGWWEWAPPCFHFRMPYWPHLKHWLRYAQRMSFLLSQGVHVCDVAVLYPTETLQAYPKTRISKMWQVADRLSASGLDYDFIDFQSLQKADVRGGSLSAAGENYKVLVLANVKALHHATWLKIKEFAANGGIVIATEPLLATSLSGSDGATADFDTFFAEHAKCFMTSKSDEIVGLIKQHIQPDFLPASGKGMVMHRRIGDRDVYMVMGVEKGEKLSFRSRGKVQLWNAMTGEIADYPVVSATAEGTSLLHDGEQNESRLYVFSPGKPKRSNPKVDTEPASTVLDLSGEWQIEIVPTLDNRWGDFRLPASHEMIGVEAREFAYKAIAEGVDNPSSLSFAASDKSVYGYAPYMQTVLYPSSADIDSLVQLPLDSHQWTPYSFSWQYGVFDNPGSQGYHGLKGKVDNRFLILDRGGHQLFATNVFAPKNGNYSIVREGVAPYTLLIDGKAVEGNAVHLCEGWHKLLIAYAQTAKAEYSLTAHKSNYHDTRHRSAVVFYDAASPLPALRNPYGDIVAMKWFDTDFLPYQLHTGANRYAFRFATAPSADTLRFSVNGTIDRLWVDGASLNPLHEKTSRGITEYVFVNSNSKKCVGEAVLTATANTGSPATAFFCQPVKISCGKGLMPLGDWTEWGAMKFYSGGVRHTKELVVNKTGKRHKYSVEFSMVDATCEVFVNGRSAGILFSPPYKLDVTKLLRRGTNKIELMVYSSLSNHYQTVPSAYKGKARAGIIPTTDITPTPP